MNLNFLKIFNTLQDAILSSSLHWQLITLTFCFSISYLIYKFSKKFLIKRSIGSDKKTSAPKTISIDKASTVNHEKSSPSSKLSKFSFVDENIESKGRKIWHQIWPINIVISHSSILLLPLITISVLIFVYLPYSIFFKDVVIFAATIKLIGCFLLLRIIRISSASSYTANLAGIFLLPTLILHIFGALDSVISYLNDLAFKVGKIKISVYLIIKAFIVVFLVFWFAGWISRKSRFYIDGNRRIKSSTKGILNKISDILIYSTAVIFVLRTFGVDLTTFAVIGGAVGVGIGLGLQKIASNFISGIILLFEKSVEVGDIVEIDNGNIYGTVKHFSGRYTLVEAMDGKEILIPNEEFITQKVVNWTYSNNRARVEISVAVAYGTDLKLAKEVMIKCAREHKKCLIRPEIECFVTSFDDSAVRIILHFWIADISEGRMGAKSDVMVAIYEEFARLDIEIPLPQREFKIKNEISSANKIRQNSEELPLFKSTPKS